MAYKVDIGLEIHVKLNTKSKLWSSASNEFTLLPNTHVSAVDLGIAGTCPVLNEQALIKAVRLGLVTNSEITMRSEFSRKHYTYPDLPSGYQITQFYKPIATNGSLYIGEHQVVINEMHIESDAGKIVNADGHILLDYNRLGCPLVEVVTAVCFHSADQVITFLNHFVRLLRHMNISDANMENGDMRVDVNISCRKNSNEPYGMRGEIKNLNSLSAIRNSINHIERTGFTTYLTCPTTLQYIPEYGTVRILRAKQSANEYAQIYDHNIAPVILTDEFVEEVRKSIGIRPEVLYESMIKEKVSAEIANAIVNNVNLTRFFLALNMRGIHVANMCVVLSPYIIENSEHDMNLIHQVRGILKLIPNKISANSASQALLEVVKKESTLEQAIAKYSLNDNKDSIRNVLVEVINENPDDWNKYKSGDEKVYNSLLGKMRSKCTNISILVAEQVIKGYNNV